MASRLELHEELCDILGSRNVYFQPPESVKLEYPCIIYELEDLDLDHADDFVYKYMRGYTIISIGKDPDSDIVDRIIRHFKYCRYSRHYITENLYHDAFLLYY